MRRKTLFLLTLASVAFAGWVYIAYRRDIQHARTRISTGSQVVTTPCGPIEYASVGEGFPVLIVHGAGGGFDQGLDFVAGLNTEGGVRAILVSRFGYLRTPLPGDASSAAQADAHACLLDALGITRAAVIGISAGTPSAVQFGLRHPERCTALVLAVPAMPVTGGEARTPEMPPLTQFLSNTVLASDFAFWAATKVARNALIENLLATPPAVAERASPAERQRTHDILMNILPVSQRRAGLINDAAVVGAGVAKSDPGRITAPTLIISAEDDLYGTHRTARDLARQIPGSRLVIYPTGGHLWAGHNDEVLAEIAAFLRPLRTGDPAGSR